MRYEGNVFRPPSEAYSLIVQATIGCAHNDCTFCSMYKDKKFRVRNIEEVLEDFDLARRRYRYIEKVFLADGDALVLKNSDLCRILDKIRTTLPECQRVGIYAAPHDILRKTPEAVLIPRADEAVVVVAVDGAHPVLAHPGDGAAGIWAVVDVVARAVDGVDVLLLREDGADALGVGVEIGDDEELQRLRSFRWSVCIDPG